MNIEFQTLSIQSGDTQTTNRFSGPIVTADVALKRFSGSNVSCQLLQINGDRVEVTASSNAGGLIEVLVIAVLG